MYIQSVLLSQEGLFLTGIIFTFRHSTYHFRFCHCHSVTRRIQCEKVSSKLYIFFSLGRYKTLSFPSLLQCRKKVSV